MFLYLLVYQLQQEAPTAVAVISVQNNCDNARPAYLGEEYHGPISNQEAQLLLQKDGHYLVRESGKQRQHHTLSLKFNNQVKHYRLKHYK